MARPRLQFSILGLFLAQFVVAALLAVRLYVDPKLYWSDVWALLGGVVYAAALVWLLFFASWTARLAAAGFVLGAAVEVGAFYLVVVQDWVTFAPGIGAPEGSYPLSLPISRLLMKAQIQPLDAPLLALCIAAITSGLIVAAITLPCWLLMRRAYGRTKRRS